MSPVPVDSAIGIEKGADYGAIKLECFGKSTLRAAIAELVETRRVLAFAVISQVRIRA